MGGGAEQEHFVDGVTESLTTDLSRIRGSFVIGRNTAFTYKGKASSTPSIEKPGGCTLRNPSCGRVRTRDVGCSYRLSSAFPHQ